jgi:hypothetical protein
VQERLKRLLGVRGAVDPLRLLEESLDNATAWMIMDSMARSYEEVWDMSRCRIFLASGLVALAGLAAAAPSASAQPPANASCVGVLSAFAGSVQGDEIQRQDFAPAPGADVAAVARQTGTVPECAALIDPPGP